MTELLTHQTLRNMSANFKTIEELYNLYGRQAFGLALRVLEDSGPAEDAVHEVFVRYWRQPTLYSPQKGPFLIWLLREVHCYCLKRLPVGLHPVETSPLARNQLSTEIIFKTTVPAEESKTVQQRTQARKALAGLPQEQREIVELAYFKGLNPQQIAHVTGQSVQTVRQRLAVGLVQLKKGRSQLHPL